MKPPIKYLNILLVLITVSCNQTKLQCQNVIKTSADSALVIEEINTGIYINYDRTKVIDHLYVIDKDGTDYKQKPDTYSETLGKYSYGEKLDIIEVKGQWFGIRDRLTRRIIENGRVIERTAWEKVYVEKSKLGELNQITLTDKDLNIISSFTQDGMTEYYEDSETLDEYLYIELIDKYAYEKGKTSVVTYVDNNTSLFQKSDGIIELKCADTIVRYIDKPDAEEDVQVGLDPY